MYVKRKSLAVVLGLVPTLAVAGCDDDQIVHCVDQNGVVVDSAFCSAPTGGGVHVHGGGFVYHHVYHPTFHPVGVPIVSGGSLTPLPGRAVTTHAIAASRGGGFGSTGARFGMGGGA